MTKQTPSTVFIEVARRCNLSCGHCGIWRCGPPASRVPRDTLKRVIERCASWDAQPEIVFTGGEPFLETDMLLDLAGTAASAGLVTVTNTNGTVLDETTCDAVCSSGLGKVAFSIDSHLGEVHDRTRGRPGVFQECIAAVRRLRNSREKLGRGPVLMSSTILFKPSLSAIPQLVDMLLHLGIESLLFQALQPPFGPSPASPMWPEGDDLWPSLELAHSGLLKLKRRRDEGAPIYLSDELYEALFHYFRSPKVLPKPVCTAWKSTAMISLEGDVRLCFAQSVHGEESVGSILGAPLDDIWNSMRARRVRVRMRACRRGCGVMNCHQ